MQVKDKIYSHKFKASYYTDLCCIFFSVRGMLEKMGKTLFFRSGQEPLILSEEQREDRRHGKVFQDNFNKKDKTQ